MPTSSQRQTYPASPIVGSTGSIGSFGVPAAAARPDASASSGGQPGGAAAQPYAGDVVALEDRVRLDRAGRHDHAAGVDLDHLVGPDQGNERPLVDANGGVALENGDGSGRRGLRRQLGELVMHRA